MDGTYAGDVDPANSYAALQASADAVLVDVRTAAEWSYVGLPDLSHIGKRVIPIEWQRFPDGTQNGSFLEQLRHAGVADGVPSTSSAARVCARRPPQKPPLAQASVRHTTSLTASRVRWTMTDTGR